jgi:signal transduction histidine kinase
VAQTHDRLLQRESLARLGEMAAGAAHEMNNPLAVISGRSQMLTAALPEGSKTQRDAQLVLEQAGRLSDMITSLHRFAEPNGASRCRTDVEALLEEVIARVRGNAEHTGHDVPIQLQIKSDLSQIDIDRDQIAGAVRELLLNATQVSPKTGVQVIAGIDPTDQQLIIQIVDDGDGMDNHVLSHATDPFFSAKPAGRRAGMGLTRASQWAAAHGGELLLQSTPSEGASAVIRIPIGQS